MKRRLLITSALLFSLSYVAKGQEVMDAYKLTQTELTGTARSMSMGGAFGALGGDISGIAINPAGIGVYKSSELVTTLNFQNVEAKTDRPDGSLKDSKFKVNFNNLAFVGVFPLYNDVAPLLNVGFSYNRLKSFDRKYKTVTGGMGHSLADYIAEKSTGAPLSTLGGDGGWFGDGADWLSMVGYRGYLIDGNGRDGDNYQLYKPTNPGMGVANDLSVKEKGSINTYDFNIGTTFEDMLSVGLTVSVTDINYKMYSFYGEDVIDGDRSGWFELENELKTEGTGVKLGLGVIFKPVQELRIGIAYHSPTWYDMTDYAYVHYNQDFTNILANMDLPPDAKNNYNPGYLDSDGAARLDYEMRTPDRWVFSLAGVLGANAIISLDYELTDYKKTKFDNRNSYYSDGWYDPVNADIKDFHKLSSTLRLGGEYRFTPQFSGRIGYQWQQSPYEKIENGGWVYTAGSIPQYVIPADKHYITWGLGYRFSKNFYTDIAFVYRTQESELYFYSNADKVDLKEDGFQGALTLGFRF